MPYTTEEGGRLNNYAVEPKISFAEPPTKSQQKTYVILGFLGAALVGGLLVIATIVSNAGA